MKQILTFTPSTIASTATKINVEAFDASVEAFEKKEYLQSLYSLLDYVDGEFRTKYGNKQGTDFSIPHGSIVVNVKIENEEVKIMAPFVALPEKGRIPVLRQVAGLNFNDMNLARILLKEDKLFFEYSCPLALAEPYKIYYVLEEICRTGDKFDDEFETKFGTQRIYEPKVTPYEPETLNTVYDVIQFSCKECMDAVKYFEPGRQFGYMWNVIDSTLLKILYYAHPQGQLLNDMDKAVREMDREDIPLPEVVDNGKGIIARLQAMTKEQLAENLYYVETFIPSKRRSNLKNIQENFESTYDKASAALESGNNMACCLMIIYKFYEMYYYNNVQDDINAVVVKAMTKASAKSFEEAAPILHEAMDDIMEDNLEVEDGDAEDSSDFLKNMQDMQQQMMQNMQQMMQGSGMDYFQKVQALQQQLAQGTLSVEEYTKQVQDLASNSFGNNQNN